MTPSVYILILVWNNISDTLECLNSIQELDYPNYSVAVIDNGSTIDVKNPIKSNFSNVHFIETAENLGYAEGNNVGIRYALSQQADFVLILNNDTIVDPQAVSELVKAGQAHPDAAVLCPKIYFSAPPTKIMFAGAEWDAESAMFKYFGLGQEDTGKEERLQETAVGSGCALLIRASAITRVGMFDPRFFLLWEEFDWCSRFRRGGYSLLYVPSAKIWHKVSQSFGEQGRSKLYQYYFTRNRLLWIEKNLNGMARVKAWMRCAHELYWRFLEARHPTTLNSSLVDFDAQLLGWRHFLTRRFGKQLVPTK